MREDLRRPGGGRTAGMTAFSKEGSSGQDGWVAVSSIMRSARKAGAGGVTQRGVLDRCWAAREEGEVLYQGRPVAGSTQTLRIDGSGLNSGVYVLRVQGERFVDSQTITLVK